jgi:hypothetical protein
MFIAALGCIPREGESFYLDDIIKKDFHQWTADECNKVLSQTMSTNMMNPAGNSPAMIFALPCTPVVLMANNRKQQLEANWTVEQSNQKLDQQARSCAGLVYDSAQNRFIDLHGNIYRTPNQLDSLMILVTVDKRFAYNAHDFNVSDMEQHIFLEDEKNLLLRSSSVRLQEQGDVKGYTTFAVMFHFGDEQPYFTKNIEDNLRLIVTGFGNPVTLPLRLDTPVAQNR